MAEEDEDKIKTIVTDALKTSLQLNIFLACLAMTLLGVYLETMRKDLKKSETAIIKLETQYMSFDNRFDHLDGRIGNLENAIFHIQ